jgi:hypothetical protein
MKCPRCGAPAECDTVDIGVGEQQTGPYRCTRHDFGCEWVQETPEIDYSLYEGEFG